jgi:hypothetical protein
MGNAAHMICVATDFPHFILLLLLTLAPKIQGYFKMIFFGPTWVEEIRVIFAMNVGTNISLAACLHLIYNPNNIKVSE